jgi:hypothetical protein
MPSFSFVDSQGIAWMVLTALPAAYRSAGEAAVNDGPLVGFTFRSSTGEVRVLPRAAFPRRASVDIIVTPLGSSPRMRPVAPGDWEELLRHAVKWPTA